MKDFRRFLISPYMILLTAAVAVFCSICYATDRVDPDVYFLISHGHDIVTAGFPSIMQHTILNIDTVLQQPLTDLIIYTFYRAFSLKGTYLLVALEYVFLAKIIYSYTEEMSEYEPVRILASSLLLLPSALYLTARPSIISMTIMFMFLTSVSIWKKSKGTDMACLIIWVLLSILQINAHASMWPFLMLFAVVSCMGGKNKTLSMYVHEVWGLLAMAAGSFIQPYTYKAPLYLINSFKISNLPIMELKKPVLLSLQGIYIVLGATVLAIYLLKKKRKADLPSVCLALLCLILAGLHVRSVWFVSVSMAPLLISLLNGVYEDVEKEDSVITKTHLLKVSPGDDLFLDIVPVIANMINDGEESTEDEKRFMADTSSDSYKRKAVKLHLCYGMLIAMACVFIAFYPYMSDDTRDMVADCSVTPITAANYLDINADRADVRLFTGFNNGAYMRFRGYDTYMDSRPELYTPAFTGDKYDYLGELMALRTEPDFDYEGFINKYGFTHLLVEKSSSFYTYLREHRIQYRREVDNGDYALFAVVI